MPIHRLPAARRPTLRGRARLPTSGSLGGWLTSPDAVRQPRGRSTDRAVLQTGAANKFRMPVVSALLARQHLRTLPERARTAEATLAVLTDILTSHKAPIAAPQLAEAAEGGWYGIPLTITEPVREPDPLLATVITADIPLRPLYDDWVQPRRHLAQERRLRPHSAAQGRDANPSATVSRTRSAYGRPMIWTPMGSPWGVWSLG